MKLTLGFSPCPNDTFIFDALVHKKIDTEGLLFDVVLSDVEQLNLWAMEGKLDVTKLSFSALAKCLTCYILLDSGSALGKNCGPILIAKPGTSMSNNSMIAVPGKHTTANLLLHIFYPNYLNKVEVFFSEIEDKILQGHVDAGVIIHENRFTYQNKGLDSVQDLGELWENETGFLLPLGGIVAKRRLPLEVLKKLDRVIRRSILFAFDNRYSSLDFVANHAQEMELEIMQSHIALYVNNYSISLGEDGRKAVELLLKKAGADISNIFL